MLNITPICKNFDKLPGHFKDSFKGKGGFGYVSEGRTQHTVIDDELIPEFLLWLSNGKKGCKQIRIILATKGIDYTLDFVKNYTKPETLC